MQHHILISAFALFLGCTGTQSINSSMSIADVAESPLICPYLNQFHNNQIEVLVEECDKNYVETDPYHQDQPDLINQQPKQRYEVEYLDGCVIGLERFRGCNQNPDSVLCEDGTSPYSRIIRFTGGPRDGETQITHQLCPEDNTPIDLRDGELVERLVITPSEFRKFPIRGSNLKSDPYKFSLRNGHTHLWAEGDTQDFNTDIRGIPTKLRAIPVGWNWNYGDGNTRNLDFPGEPAPEHTLRDKTPTSHFYTETGTYGVGLTTLFRGEFSVDGGPWQAIPGQAAVPSDPIEIDVWRTKKQLIATD